ncbi:nitroreductase [Prochlorococcus sp. MIT 1341]|uniref:nitroreductase family protein n=1 Tax=Prochlorococcus sp. MIT 1341 TaxID=3096221 RepID=UPI002A759AC5|nr:nitroreductase [Prochlorococcus sp. MIT 1341]
MISVNLFDNLVRRYEEPMDLQEAIKNRRTIHSFNTKKVPEIIIERAIEAANFAPCHMHTFPWRFTSLQMQKRQLLVQLALELKFENCSPDQISKGKILKKMLNPSHLLVVSQVVNADPKRKLEDYAACACAIQNLSLSLVGEGVGSKWSTGKITTDKNTYKIVGIDQGEEEIIGFIWVGYGEAPLEIKRPLISSIFRR